MTTQCPICRLEKIENDLVRHYLADHKLIAFIQTKRPEWNPEEKACSQCLEQYYRELYSMSISGGGFSDPVRREDEKTVITHTGDVLDEESGETDACLIMIHGPDLGRRFEIKDGEMILGRSETAGVRINEENVSRQHAKVFKQKDSVIVEDLRSTNGTFVNTKKITSKPLVDGDLILIGNTILKFISGSHIESEYHEEIYKLATLDGLTKVFNKKYFLEKLDEEFGRSQRYRRSLTLILFDFDHFKNLNDTYGHPAGDFVLTKTSSMVLANLRKEDICGRYGGEEFGIILPETKFEQGIQLAEKIRALIEKTDFVVGDHKFRVTVSMGVAVLDKTQKKATQLIKKTDEALYRAKNEGRNCVRT